VTALRRLDAPTGLRPGDHVCWTLADTSDFSAVVLPHLEEGRRLGDHLLLIGASRPPLVQASASLPERDEILARGQLEVRGDRDPLAHLSGRGPWLSLHGEVDVTQADCVLRALLDIVAESPAVSA
jgi:hypothetical protein